MRKRSPNPSPSRSSSGGSEGHGHIVVFDEQCFPSDEPSKIKKRSPILRCAGKLTRLVAIAAFCLVNGAFLFHSSWRNKLTTTVRNLARQGTAAIDVANTSTFAENKAVEEENSSVEEQENSSVEEQENSAASTTTKIKVEKQNNAAISKSSAKLPNVLVIGAQESGTTSVASWLFHHNNVCKPVSVPGGKPIKEVHFFGSKSYKTHSPEDYHKHYEHCGDRTILVDATPSYMKYSKRIRETYDKLGDQQASNLKVVMILREPVGHEFAWYREMAADSKKPNPHPYTSSVLNKKGQLISFEKYTDNTVLPKLKASIESYAKSFREWTDKFQRKQLLVLSYDELIHDPKSAAHRLQTFLKLDEDLSEMLEVEQTTAKLPSCPAQLRLSEAFAESNNDLYELLDSIQGPDAEQKPFPKFELSPCKSLEGENEQKNTNHRKPPATVFFATHHKTGTDISRSVASLLNDKGMAKYSAAYLDETDLLKNTEGEDMKCSGSVDKPEIRSYNQWSKWIIEPLWKKCVKAWWNNWPGEDTDTKDLFENCIMGEMDSLKAKLKEASCGNDYLVVHFVRNPIRFDA